MANCNRGAGNLWGKSLKTLFSEKYGLTWRGEGFVSSFCLDTK